MGTLNASLYSVTTSTGFEFINVSLDPNTIITYTPTTLKIDNQSPRLYFAIEFNVVSGNVYWVYELEEMRDEDILVLIGATIPSTGLIKYSAENLTQLNTTATTWVTHSTLTTPSLPSKSYSISWGCEVTNSSANRWTGLRGRVNGVVYFDIEPVSRRGDRFQAQTFFKNLSLIGVVVIELQFNNTTQGTSRVRNSQIQIIG